MNAIEQHWSEQEANFIENGNEGRPALALIATRKRILKKSGVACIKVPAGYIRAVRLIAQEDGGGLRQARRELLYIVGGSLGKSWRIAEGTA